VLEKKLILNNEVTPIANIIQETFIKINKKLNNKSGIYTEFSGSTCASIILTPEKIISANVGDSRAIIGRNVKGKWESVDLTRDHKPTETDEAERIKRNNGRILQFKDEDDNEFVGPMRVWVKHDDIPGLAMSRSFGDQVAASVGVISVPEIKEYKFDAGDSFIVIASDGVWEFLESDECVNIVKKFYLKNDITGASEYLIKESSKRWLKEGDVIDDITLIVIFLK